MNILIDIGNTVVKISFVESTVISDPIIVEQLTLSYLQSIISQMKIKSGILSSVKNIDKKVIRFLETKLNPFIVLNPSTRIPIENLYRSPQTLGNDRISAAVGANLLFPDTNLLLFDFGTAITIDCVNSGNQYTGGSISPGLHTRFKALHTFTDQLPLLDKSGKENEMFGKTTEEAIISGVQNGIVYEIEGYIREFKNKFNKFNVIFTGGDALFFEKKIKSSIFVELKLVFIGLNRILEYNVK